MWAKVSASFCEMGACTTYTPKWFFIKENKTKCERKGQEIVKVSNSKEKYNFDKTQNNLHGISKSLFALGSVDFWNNEPWDREGKQKQMEWMKWMKGKDKKNQTSHIKTGQT